jgi:Raf kinase inhibitor-like YbhB/YbcL family protein
MTITSTAFQNGEPIPAEYGVDGRNVNPPLTFSEVPPEAKSLLLIVEDPDAPNGIFTHWILYNMSPAVLQILEGELPLGAQQATNDFGALGYGGPKPPAGETHRYVFRLLALDITLKDARPTDRRAEITTLLEGHVIAEAAIVGMFASA